MILYCVILFILYCTVLYCIVLYCIVLYCIVLHCIVFFCTVSRYLEHEMSIQHSHSLLSWVTILYDTLYITFLQYGSLHLLIFCSIISRCPETQVGRQWLRDARLHGVRQGQGGAWPARAHRHLGRPLNMSVKTTVPWCLARNERETTLSNLVAVSSSPA